MKYVVFMSLWPCTIKILISKFIFLKNLYEICCVYVTMALHY